MRRSSCRRHCARPWRIRLGSGPRCGITRRGTLRAGVQVWSSRPAVSSTRHRNPQSDSMSATNTKRPDTGHRAGAHAMIKLSLASSFRRCDARRPAIQPLSRSVLGIRGVEDHYPTSRFQGSVPVYLAWVGAPLSRGLAAASRQRIRAPARNGTTVLPSISIRAGTSQSARSRVTVSALSGRR